MTPEQVLKDIFERKLVCDEAGIEYPLASNIDSSGGEFLRQLVRKHQPKTTIEIGCAQGISSLYICSELQKTAGAHHTIVDGWQSTGYKNIGINNLKKAGLDCFDLIEGVSEIVLPRLLSEQKNYDFCFIDGNHTFDHTLLDFFYLNRMTKVGGIIVLDDVGMPAVNKVARYILNYPAYRQIGSVQYELSFKRRLFERAMKAPLRLFSKLLGTRVSNGIFAQGIIKSDQQMDLNASMIAVQKIGPDERNWHWYKDF
jgi:predicted O-methyltransferase YrrM